jgi:hypothetical protein
LHGSSVAALKVNCLYALQLAEPKPLITEVFARLKKLTEIGEVFQEEFLECFDFMTKNKIKHIMTVNPAIPA